MGNKKNKNKTKDIRREKTISSTLSNSLTKIIDEINRYYYVKMQPDKKTGKIEHNEREKYIKKYDKMQNILLSKSDNKRAQMELMLVLINEGYRDEVKVEFPKEDYELIDKLIKEYYDKKVKPEEAKKQIDDYCI